MPEAALPAPPLGLLEALRSARRPLVLTGAGMSAESGIATFRGGEDSLWSRFDPTQLATADAFDADPALVWAWYRWRMAKLRMSQPHAGHAALAALARLRPGLVLATQNVDDLHERAGGRGVLHLHGEIAATRCRRCDRPQAIEIDPAWAERPQLRAAPPACAVCGGPLRPGVVWFGESPPARALRAAIGAAQVADLVLVVGTSGLVYPAAGLPAAAPASVPRYEINPEPSALSAAMDGLWRAQAGVALPRLVELLAQ
ncbi:MAG: NAD-dependent protein deacylase [Aquimonas sp.]|nr:NAD-dependent protein deacylase [Aquimonas sp.]